jgi:lactoylglutathione lyase
MALIHTCYRITDIERSISFYEALGFKEIGRIPIRDEAINIFMNQPGDGDMPRLELTHNFGVDSYEIGTGYGHIAITAEDLDATLARLAEQGIEPEKRHTVCARAAPGCASSKTPMGTGSRSSRAELPHRRAVRRVRCAAKRQTTIVSPRALRVQSIG